MIFPSPLLLLSMAALPLLLLCSPVLAQAKVTADAKALVERIDAARGAAKLPATLTVRGSYAVFFGAAGDQPVAKGAFTEWFAGEQRARHESDMGPMGKLERGITTDLAWELDPMMGAKRYDGPAGATVRRYFAMLRGQSPTQLYAEIACDGEVEIDGGKCQALAMTPASGKPERWIVEPATGYVRRVEMMLPSPDSAGSTFDMDEWIASKVSFDDWRKGDGAAFPHQRTLEMGPAKVVSAIESVVAGGTIDDARFAPPEAAAKLPPKAASKPIDAGDGPSYQVVDRERQFVASIRLECKESELAATMAIVLPEVMAHLTATGAKMAGPPFSRYHSFGDTVDLEAGIPVAKPIEAKGRVKNSELPAGKVVTAWHVGPYDKLGAAHLALQGYAKEHGLTAAGGPWEIYWTDPGMVPDPKKWRTQLFLPVAK